MNAPQEKIQVGGLKLSLELIQIQLTPATPLPVHDVLALLTAQHINLTLLTLDSWDGRLCGVFCISAADRIWSEMALKPIAGTYRSLSPVGSLTVFPHHSRIAMIGKILCALHRAKIPIHAMGSSLSALTLTVPHGQMNEAVNALLSVISLPENHAPLLPEFTVRQL